jgi:3-methyladenine DNA glycosylase/8-oxoguanine DNA glycosylase
MADKSAEIIQMFGAGRSDVVAEGLRLVKAFMQIRDPDLRDSLVAFAERLAKIGQAPDQRDKS